MSVLQNRFARKASAYGFYPLLLSLALWFGMCQLPAAARPTYPPVVIATYHPKAGGAIEKAAQTCQLCHAGGPPALNVYGRDVKAALKQAGTKTLTPAVLHSLDTKDSDGDGFPNGVEFADDTLPGDAKSKPAGKPDVTPHTPTAAPAEPNPFALKTLLFPDHAQHPVLVHFPIALFTMSLVFDFIGYKRRNPALMLAGYYNLLVAGVMAPLTVGTGVLAWQFLLRGEALKGLLLYHLLFGITTMLLIEILLFLRLRRFGRELERGSSVYFALCLLTFTILSLTGHIGGTMTYYGT